MDNEKRFPCSFEWDEEDGRDAADDKAFVRHRCVRMMHHEDDHQSEEGATKPQFVKDRL